MCRDGQRIVRGIKETVWNKAKAAVCTGADGYPKKDSMQGSRHDWMQHKMEAGVKSWLDSFIANNAEKLPCAVGKVSALMSRLDKDKNEGGKEGGERGEEGVGTRQQNIESADFH